MSSPNPAIFPFLLRISVVSESAFWDRLQPLLEEGAGTRRPECAVSAPKGGAAGPGLPGSSTGRKHPAFGKGPSVICVVPLPKRMPPPGSPIQSPKLFLRPTVC